MSIRTQTQKGTGAMSVIITPGVLCRLISREVRIVPTPTTDEDFVVSIVRANDHEVEITRTAPADGNETNFSYYDGEDEASRPALDDDDSVKFEFSNTDGATWTISLVYDTVR